MPSSVKSSVLLPAEGMEFVTLVSGLGTEMQLYLAVSDSANRQTNLDNALALLDTNDQAVIDYAAAHDLSAPTEPTS